jgi:acylphosphatase
MVVGRADDVGVRVRATVRGRVQGVGFRWSARAAADGLGLAGFASNQRDGSVLVEAEGSAENVDAMLDWLRRAPPGARVVSVGVERLPPTGDVGFHIE